MSVHFFGISQLPLASSIQGNAAVSVLDSESGCERSAANQTLGYARLYCEQETRRTSNSNCDLDLNKRATKSHETTNQTQKNNLYRTEDTHGSRLTSNSRLHQVSA
jgi:hypothetical protein